MTVVTIGEIATQIRGVTYGKSDVTDRPTADHIPVVRANNITDHGLVFDDLVYVKNAQISAKQRIIKGDIVVAASSGSLSVVGKAAQAEADYEGSFGAFCKIVRPGPKVDPRYLGHFFKTTDYRRKISSLAAGANINNLKSEHLNDLEIPLPPLPEQRRIAAILDQADALRRLRRQSLSRLSDLGQSIFYEMFGDTNQDSTSTYNATVGDACSVSSGSTPSRKIEGYYGGSIPWVKTTEVQGGPISSVEEFLTEAGRSAARLKLYPPKTILVAMYGQGKTRGNVGYLTFSATVNQACAALQCNERCIPEFLFFQLKSSYDRLRRLGQGGNQPNLNGEIVRSFPIVLPAIERQNDFLETFERIRESENQMADCEERMNSLFGSLQHRAFRGEL